MDINTRAIEGICTQIQADGQVKYLMVKFCTEAYSLCPLVIV